VESPRTSPKTKTINPHEGAVKGEREKKRKSKKEETEEAGEVSG
jgi:hypothetical protein